jgi:hypothetical protein
MIFNPDRDVVVVRNRGTGILSPGLRYEKPGYGYPVPRFTSECAIASKKEKPSEANLDGFELESRRTLSSSF